MIDKSNQIHAALASSIHTPSRTKLVLDLDLFRLGHLLKDELHVEA